MVPPAKSPSVTVESDSSAHVATVFPDDGGTRSASTTLLPSFDGEDPIGWLTRVEQQLELNRTPPHRQVGRGCPLLGDLVEGAQTRHDLGRLVARFDSRFQGNQFERLAGAKQIGLVEDYNTLFVQLASQVLGLSDDRYLGYFMNGLKESICSSLHLFRPGNLEEAMKLARNVEHNLSVQNGGSGSPNYIPAGVRSNNFLMSNPSPPLTASGGNLQGSSGSFPKDSGQHPGTMSGLSGQPATRSQFTRLPPKEFAELRAKGLCSMCKKPFTPGHDCPFKQLWVMIAEEYELDLQQHEYCEITGQEKVLKGQGSPEGDEGYFSVYSMAGNFSSRSARFQPSGQGYCEGGWIDREQGEQEAGTGLSPPSWAGRGQFN
ncbi:unnamed protein product [Cuscuta epithymum]|uniref:Retrotransposon gag domain-containing protein n=1 Tax=Cuscuta epithymum TaxID=186058 RepID=A0AAV0DM23_9ASTE|nr:unnamed protein product [Cuscuta epithymum]